MILKNRLLIDMNLKNIWRISLRNDLKNWICDLWKLPRLEANFFLDLPKELSKSTVRPRGEFPIVLAEVPVTIGDCNAALDGW